MKSGGGRSISDCLSSFFILAVYVAVGLVDAKRSRKFITRVLNSSLSYSNWSLSVRLSISSYSITKLRYSLFASIVYFFGKQTVIHTKKSADIDLGFRPKVVPIEEAGRGILTRNKLMCYRIYTPGQLTMFCIRKCNATRTI